MSRVQLAGAVIAMALVVGFPAMAAQNEGGPRVGAPQRDYTPEPAVTLTGMLKSDGADGYILVDQQSGDSIALKRKSKKLGAQEGKMVSVEGQWAHNDETSKKFKVSKVEPAPAAAAQTQTAPATQAAPATQSTTPQTPQSAAPQSPTTPQSPTNPTTPQSPTTPQNPATPQSPAPESPSSDSPPQTPSEQQP